MERVAESGRCWVFAEYTVLWWMGCRLYFDGQSGSGGVLVSVTVDCAGVEIFAYLLVMSSSSLVVSAKRWWRSSAVGNRIEIVGGGVARLGAVVWVVSGDGDIG